MNRKIEILGTEIRVSVIFITVLSGLIIGSSVSFRGSIFDSNSRFIPDGAQKMIDDPSAREAYEEAVSPYVDVHGDKFSDRIAGTYFGITRPGNVDWSVEEAVWSPILWETGNRSVVARAHYEVSTPSSEPKVIQFTSYGDVEPDGSYDFGPIHIEENNPVSLDDRNLVRRSKVVDMEEQRAKTVVNAAEKMGFDNLELSVTEDGNLKVDARVPTF